jgi:energy-coupling factor transporter ATP-binding protein EcfA2
VIGKLRRPVPADRLVESVDGLRRFVEAAGAHLDASRLAPAQAVVRQAGERLALSREHTVVALAGATGSGKSSIFNALAGVELSTVGRRRPTTGTAHACVWGPADAGGLLDWLGVTRRFGHGEPADLTGLVLLDLPDFDSVRAEHRIESDRLLKLVDLVIWVLDPQKYADKVVHQRYLAEFHRHREITVVVLNQADLLAPADVERCLVDLRRLLEADGLTGVPVLATSTVMSADSAEKSASSVGEPGLSALRAAVAGAVEARLAALARLAADVDGAVAQLWPTVATELPAEELDRATVASLVDSLAAAAGVPVVVRATERGYRYRAVRTAGWPVTRWLGRFRPDPLRRLRLSTSRTVPSTPSTPDGVVGVTSLPPAGPAASAAVGLALRAVAERAGTGLPAPWPAAVLAAARSRAGDLTDALDSAVARTELDLDRRPLWWRAVGLVQWLVTLAAVVGLGWLLLRFVLLALGLPDLVPAPQVGRVPWPTLLLVGGLLAGLFLAAAVRPVIHAAARRRGRRVAARLASAVERVADDLVLTPVGQVRHAYATARAALVRSRPR